MSRAIQSVLRARQSSFPVTPSPSPVGRTVSHTGPKESRGVQRQFQGLRSVARADRSLSRVIRAEKRRATGVSAVVFSLLRESRAGARPRLWRSQPGHLPRPESRNPKIRLSTYRCRACWCSPPKSSVPARPATTIRRGHCRRCPADVAVRLPPIFPVSLPCFGRSGVSIACDLRFLVFVGFRYDKQTAPFPETPNRPLNQCASCKR